MRGGFHARYDEHHLPTRLEDIVFEIESVNCNPSKIPLGTKEDKFYQIFGQQFTPPVLEEMDKGLWPVIDAALNGVIGSDVCLQNLRHGKYGAHGLLRPWLKDARKWAVWNSDIDQLIEPKLERVLSFLKIGIFSQVSTTTAASKNLNFTKTSSTQPHHLQLMSLILWVIILGWESQSQLIKMFMQVTGHTKQKTL